MKNPKQKHPIHLRTFKLRRAKDVSGVSGTGDVAVGIVLPSGRCILEWLTQTRSFEMFDNFNEAMAIHGHDGASKAVRLELGEIDV